MNKASNYVKIKRQGPAGQTRTAYEISLVVEQQEFLIRITESLKETRWLKRQLVFALKKIQNDAILSMNLRDAQKKGPKLKPCDKCSSYCGVRTGNCGCDCHDR